jgi:N-acetylneuraminic acid mutarotase
MNLKKATLIIALVAILLVSYLTNITVVSGDSTLENTWKTRAEIPQTGGGMRAAVANGKLYVISSSFNYEYDPAADSWVAKTKMPTPRDWFSIASYQNNIYVLGGRFDGNSLDTSEVYDPLTDTWKSLKPMSASLSDVDANVVDGQIYVIGGTSRDSPMSSFNQMYDIAKDSWANKTVMPYPVIAYESAVYDNKVYVIGGLGYLLSNQTQIYDPHTDSWSLGAPAPTAVYNGAAAATTGVNALRRIYVIGGEANGKGMDSLQGITTCQIYNPSNDTWILGASMPTARLGLAVAVLADQIYTIGGTALAVFNPYLTANEQYTPLGYGTPDPSYSNDVPEFHPNILFSVCMSFVFLVGACLLLRVKRYKC